MLAGLAAGDANEQVGHAWIAAQELRLLYRCPDRGRAERHLLRWFTDVAEHEIPELVRLARTLGQFGYLAPFQIDAEGNNDRIVCGVPLPDVYQEIFFPTSTVPVIYLFRDNTVTTPQQG